MIDAKFSKPRKLPKQERSRSTVERILQATAELIEEQGSMNVSTNKIIEHANISPGSLYQYFPNREAVFLALYEHVSSKAAKDIRAEMMRFLNDDVEIGVPRILMALLQIYERRQIILLRFIEDMPELKLEANMVSFRNFIHGSMRSYLTLHEEELDFAHLERSVYFIQNTALDNIRRFILDAPEHTNREEFIDELSRLVIRYLRG